MKAAIYARVSTDEQKNNFSLPTQLEACREYAAANGIEIVAEFQEDYTGTEITRPELDKVRTLAEESQIDHVITLELDRLGRGLVIQLIVESDFKHYGVDVHYVLAQYDDSPEGQLSKNLRAVIGEYERAKFMERSRRGKLGRLKAGFVLGGGPDIYGYHYVKKSDAHKGYFEVVDAEAIVVRLIYELFASEKHGKKISSRAIARHLSDLRIPTRFDTLEHRKKKKRGYGFWSEGTIKKILRNEMYAGVYWYHKTKLVKVNGKTHRERQPRDKWISVPVDAIVERNLWDDAQDQRKINQLESPRNKKHDRPYLLRGRMTCAKCGSLFACDSDPRRNLRLYYRCGGTRATYSADLRTVQCHGVLRAESLDERVWAKVWQIIQDPNTALEAERQRQRDQDPALIASRIKTLDKEIAATNKQKSMLLEKYLKGKVDHSDYDDQYDLLKRQISALERQRENISQKQQQTERKIDVIRHVAELAEHLKRMKGNIKYEHKLEIMEAFNVTCTVERDSDGNVTDIMLNTPLISAPIEAGFADTP